MEMSIVHWLYDASKFSTSDASLNSSVTRYTGAAETAIWASLNLQVHRLSGGVGRGRAVPRRHHHISQNASELEERRGVLGSKKTKANVADGQFPIVVLFFSLKWTLYCQWMGKKMSVGCSWPSKIPLSTIFAPFFPPRLLLFIPKCCVSTWIVQHFSLLSSQSSGESSALI